MKIETKVALLFLTAVMMVVGFSYFMGAFNFLSSENQLHVLYNFAGGVEVGSPVRVMGIKVGRVTAIEFDPNQKGPNGDEVKLRVSIAVSKKAWDTIRSDSQFFINLAGVIGEKFIEITPGLASNPIFQPGDSVRGIDPPRIDQLLSQSYDLAGRVIDLIEKNKGSIGNTISMIDRLVVNFDKLLRQIDKTTGQADVGTLVKNLVQISGDIASVTGRMRSQESQKTIDLLHDLVWRLEKVDGPTIKKFFQDEGIRAKIF